MSITYKVKGGSALRGIISVKGSPLAAVGVLAASLLTTDKVTITNVPHLKDLDTLMNELRGFGIAIDWTHSHEITVHAAQVASPSAIVDARDVVGWPPSLLAAILVRCRQLTIDIPPPLQSDFNYLWPILEQFGAQITKQSHTVISLNHLHAASLDLQSMGSDQTLTTIILAATADGTTLIDGAVINPEVEDVMQCLRHMNGVIDRVDESRLQIQGQSEMAGTTHAIVPDRYEAAFLATAAYMTAGDVQIEGVKSALIMPFLAKIQQMTGRYTVDSRSIRFWRDTHDQEWQPIQLVAKPFPGLSEDWLLLFTPLSSLSQGECIFSSDHEDELAQALSCLKAFLVDGYLVDQDLHLFGPTKIKSAEYTVNDFAGGIVGLLLSLAANEQSTLHNMAAIDGRFESLADRLIKLGAKIDRHD